MSETDPLRYDFNSGKPTAESLHNFIVRHTPGRPHPGFSRPTNWVLIGSVLTAVVGVSTAIYQAWAWIFPLVSSKNLWRGLVLILVLYCIGGGMFNAIRSTPYVGQDGRGHISYIAGGFQSQFAIETQIVAFLCKSSPPPPFRICCTSLLRRD